MLYFRSTHLAYNGPVLGVERKPVSQPFGIVNRDTPKS